MSMAKGKKIMDVGPLSSESAPVLDETLAAQEQRIRDGLAAFWQIGDALKVIRDEQLFLQRGYPSFPAYCAAVWHFTDRNARYLISAALIYDFILTVSASGDTLPTHPTQLRPLASLPIEQAAESWQNAASNHPQPTEKDVERERAILLVNASGYGQINQQMTDGEISPQEALKRVTSFDSCAPEVTLDLIKLGVVDPTVIREMNRISKSETYSVIVSSGYVQFEDGTGLPIEKAAAAHLRRMLDEARMAHIMSGNNAHKQLVELYPNDPQKSLERLESQFGSEFVQGMMSIYNQRDHLREDVLT